MIFLTCSFLKRKFIDLFWFELIMISSVCLTGILLARQYHKTKRIHFLKRMQVTSKNKIWPNQSYSFLNPLQGYESRKEKISIQEDNQEILKSILPYHVINHFLTPRLDQNQVCKYVWDVTSHASIHYSH